MRQNTLLKKVSGVGIVRTILLIPLLLIVALIAWGIFAEARKSYWDGKVETLCKLDGGIRVFERAQLDARYFDAEKNIRIPAKPSIHSGAPFKWEAKPDDPFFYEIKIDIIRDDHPRVAKNIVELFRSQDGKILGQAVSYGRVGGDSFAIDFPSRKNCPESLGESDLFKAVFIAQTK